jgi:high affinity sulfate transporter 1
MTSPPPPIPAPRHARTRGLRRWLPGLALLNRRSGEELTRDITAGLALTALLVPVGMGYAEATGLPVIYGLYATIVPLLVYAIFGPSRILVIGPDSALSSLIAATVLPLAHGDPVRAATLAAALAILSGAFCILAGVARFGFITDLLSKPVRYGYLNGIAVTLLVSQLPKLLGAPSHNGSFPRVLVHLAEDLSAGKGNSTSFLIGLGCLIAIFAFRRWAPRWPGVLLAVAGATIAVKLLDPAMSAQLSVVGALPQGLPGFRIPHVTLDELLTLAAGATAIVLVSIADMSVLSRIYAMRGNYYVNDNQELIALGIANVATGLFQGFSVSSSASRTPVAESAGARSQLTGVVGALCIALLLIFAPQLMRHVPLAALSAVVIAAGWSILEIREVQRLYRLRRGEFALSTICFLGVALLGVVQGIFIAVGLSLLLFIWRAWRPYHAVLGRVDGMKGYHDISRHPEARRIPGLLLFRWDAPLFFANAEMFREQVLRALSQAPERTRWVVVAAEPVTDVDITAADVLAELYRELAQADIRLCFAEMKGPVKDNLKVYGLFDAIGADYFFPTIGQAVDRYSETFRIGWVDWEDALRQKPAVTSGPQKA